MRVLIDECLPRRLTRLLVGHHAKTVPQMGWAGVANGGLLQLMAGQFDAFITIDGHLHYEQNLHKLTVGLIVLKAKTNKIEDVEPLVPEILEVLPKLQIGQMAIVGSG